MKATHPKTGKPISILRTEAHLTKNSRTMLWHAPTLTGPAQRWQRYSTLVTDAASLQTCLSPDLIFLYDEPTESDVATWSKWFSQATQQSLAVLTPKWMVALKLNAAENSSILVTSEINQRYPYLPALTLEDTKESWILSFAQLMRFHKIVTPRPLPADAQRFTGTIQQIAADADSKKIVPSIYLIQQYYVPSRVVRRNEIKLALQKNIECEYIDKIILLNETKCELPQSDKIQQIVIGHRLTYLDVFAHIKSSVPADTIVAFSNSDIYLDETLRQLYSVDLERKFLALLRYDVSDKGEIKLFGPRPDSQDTWILWSSSVDFTLSPDDFGFNFGIPGCDNTITITMLRKKFAVVNPALTIRTYHLHSSNIRNYQVSDVIDKPAFLYVEPTAIQEYGVLSDLSPFKVAAWAPRSPRSFQRPIKYVDERTAETICTMMKRESHYNYSITSPNIFNKGYGELDNQLYKFEGTTFVMPAGIVCDFKNLYVGKHHIWRDEWSNVPITVLTNTVAVPCMAAVHFPAHYNTNAAKWFLHYLPQVLKIRAMKTKGEPRPEFIVPVHPDTQRALQVLRWPEDGNITIIPYLPDCQYVSEKVYALTPNSFHDVPAENIDFLRTMLPTPPKSTQPIAVIVAERNGEKQISKLFAEELKKCIFDRPDNGKWQTYIIDADTQTEVRLSLMMRADIVIAQSDSEWDALDWVWLMKSKSTVVEVMLDTAPRGDHIHLAGAAGINYVLLGVKREPLPFQRAHALEDVEKILKQHMFTEVLRSSVPVLPTVIIPTGKALTGIHEHSGDTFREMARLWSERGYCNLVLSEDTPYCWWNAIGDTLLYDRPTMRWFTNPSYKAALFGNTFPETPTKRDKPWSFWPRSPRAVEDIVASTNVNRQYGDRNPSIFLGRIENGVQQERRSKHDWSTAVDTFSMPIDSTGGPYKYSQEQYLDMLTKSRFGLCLPGYGPKCNREIEYFATGVVPIVTPGVDMKNYMVPPQKGIHYMYAETPEEVRNIVDSLTEEQWIKMSAAGKQWWQRYASAEGLFRFTWGIHQKLTEPQ